MSIKQSLNFLKANLAKLVAAIGGFESEIGTKISKGMHPIVKVIHYANGITLQSKRNFVHDENVTHFAYYTHKNCNITNMKTLFDNELCRPEEELTMNQLVSIHLNFVPNTINKAIKNSEVNRRKVNNTPTQN